MGWGGGRLKLVVQLPESLGVGACEAGPGSHKAATLHPGMGTFWSRKVSLASMKGRGRRARVVPGGQRSSGQVVPQLLDLGAGSRGLRPLTSPRAGLLPRTLRSPRGPGSFPACPAPSPSSTSPLGGQVGVLGTLTNRPPGGGGRGTQCCVVTAPHPGTWDKSGLGSSA